LEQTQIKTMNIFICQTPFQLYYAMEIIKHFTTISGVKKKNLVFHSNLNFIDNNAKYFNLGKEQGVFNRFTRFKKAIKIIDVVIRTSNDKVDFFIPHISGLLPNYIFHHKNTIDNNSISVNFFYEGILYFYDYKERFQKFHIQRFLLGVLLGFRYRIKKTILPYNSPKVKHIYTPIQKFTKGNSLKVIELPFEQKQSIEINTNNYLILGGPIVFLRKFYEDCISQISKSSNKEFIIYYKGHSSFETHNPHYKNIFSEVASKSNIKYFELSNNEPVELLIEKVKPSITYSYYSSALLNISLMFPNNFKIICYLHEHDSHFRIFKSIFNHFNIKTVFVN
tara:strand:+ start:6414 stop:7424 length:1011 start_codon:yes stop_codon:yes gene_type:complete